MRHQIILASLTALVLGGCTTAYKTGQTPDDVYYSPQRAVDEYVQVDTRRDGRYTYNDDYYDDRYLRMKVADRYRWSELNDWYYFDRYSYGYNYYFGSYYNPYNSWNYYYNPYCPRNVVIVNPGHVKDNRPAYTPPRNFNLAGYGNNNYSNTNLNAKSGRPVVIRPGTGVNNNNNQSGYNNTNNGLSNRVNRWFSGNNNSNYNNSNNNSSNSTSRPDRSYTPSSNNNSSSSSSSSGSSSSSSSSGGGVSRPTRGGN